MISLSKEILSMVRQDLATLGLYSFNQTSNIATVAGTRMITESIDKLTAAVVDLGNKVSGSSD